MLVYKIDLTITDTQGDSEWIVHIYVLIIPSKKVHMNKCRIVNGSTDTDLWIGSI